MILRPFSLNKLCSQFQSQLQATTHSLGPADSYLKKSYRARNNHA